MAITIQLPREIEEDLRKTDPHLEDSFRDAWLIDRYRQGHLTTGEVASILGLQTRFEADDWLAARGVERAWNEDDAAREAQAVRELGKRLEKDAR